MFISQETLGARMCERFIQMGSTARRTSGLVISVAGVFYYPSYSISWYSKASPTMSWTLPSIYQVGL
jgi:hypothetical protein